MRHGVRITHLHDHHVAIKCSAAARLGGTVDATTNLGDHRATDGHVRHEVAVHDVDMEPVGALLNLLGAVMAEIGEVGAENGGSNNRRGCHGVIEMRGVQRDEGKEKKQLLTSEWRRVDIAGSP